MAGFDYARMTATASRLLERFAQGTVTLTRSVPGEPDPDTPWIPGEPTTTTYTLNATVKGVSDKYVDGTTILATDLEVTCAVFETEPLPSDELSIDGQTVTVVKTMTIPAAGNPVAHKFIVRG
jgi:hypothetical protein